jgi:Flp pilus assembly protein TadD
MPDARPLKPRTDNGRRLWRLGLALALTAALAVCALVGRWAGIERRAQRFLEDSRAAAAQGRWATALRLARDALRLRPDRPEICAQVAVALTRLGRSGDAEAFYRRAGRLEPEVQHLRAEALLAAGLRDPAAEVYATILREHPRDAESLRRLAGLRLAEQRFDEALDLADRLIGEPSTELVGQTISAIIRHDMAARKAAPPSGAIAAFERILVLDPDLKDVPLRPARLFWDFLARNLLEEGRTMEARTHLQRGLSAGDDAGLEELLARTYWDEGRIDEAERHWGHARELDPKLSDPWLGLGRIALARKDFDRAIALFREAESRSPGSIVPLQNLVRAYRLRGDRNEADLVQRQLDRLRGNREQVSAEPARTRGSAPRIAP